MSIAPKSKSNGAQTPYTLPNIPLSSSEEEEIVPSPETLKMVGGKKSTRSRPDESELKVSGGSESKSRRKATAPGNDSKSCEEDDEEDQLASSSEMSSESSRLEDLEAKDPSAVDVKFAEEVCSARLRPLFPPSLTQPHRLHAGSTESPMPPMMMTSTSPILSPRTSHLSASLRLYLLFIHLFTHPSIRPFSPPSCRIFHHLVVHPSTRLPAHLCLRILKDMFRVHPATLQPAH